MIKGWLNTQSQPEKLLKRYQSTGEVSYLTALVELFNRPIYHYLMTLTDQHTAEDILQITWLKVIKAKPLTQHQPYVKAWLFSIARNSLIDELRQQNKWHTLQGADEKYTFNTLECEIVGADLLAKFNQAITQLSFVQKEAFIFQQEGFSVLEICQLTGEDFETIKSRLRYARQNLKRLMSNI